MRAAAWAALFSIVAAEARAQVIPGGLSASGAAYNSRLVIRYEGAVAEQTGTLVGGAGSLRVGPIALTVGGFTGKLTSAEPSAVNPDRSVRATTVALYLAPEPVFAVGAEVEARRYETTAGVAWERLVGGSASLALPLGPAGLRGGVQLDYLPVASVSGADSLDRAIRGTFGLAYAPPRVPIVFSVAYRLERYDFKASGSQPARLEQLDGIVIGAGLRLGR